jgi:hypothetical protein
MVLTAAAAEVGPEVRALIEHFQAHRRVALGYLQANNPDLAAIELERLQSDFAADRRKVTSDDAALAGALSAADAAVSAGLAEVDAGNLGEARALVERAAARIDDWRRAHGLRLFADCIAELGAVYRGLDAYRAAPPDLASEKLRTDILARAVTTATAAQRCDREAPPAIRDEPEFRRLIDGLAASLRQIPDAVRSRDDDLLRRLLDEERAFDRLLAFRFG